jgi:hypothetical protein
MSTFTIHERDGAIAVDGRGDGLDLWNALRRYYLARYPSGVGVGGLRYPETTNGDVRAVIAILTRQLGRTSTNVAGYDDEARRWGAVAKRANVAMRGAADGDRFADNLQFWTREARRLAVYLAVAPNLPTRDELLGDFAQLTANAPARLS